MAKVELDARVNALLAAAREADAPTAEDRARIGAAFAVQLASVGVVLPASPAQPQASAPGGGSTGLGSAPMLHKLALAAAGALALGAATAAFVAFHGQPKTTASARASVPVAPLPTALEAAPPRLAPSSHSAVPAVEEAPAAAPVASPTPRNEGAAATQARSARGTQRSGGDDLAAELALIEAATTSLHAGQPIRALTSLALHAQRYPNGALREEREGLHVLSLCAAGEFARGRAERQRFLERAPHAVLAEQVRAACSKAPGATRP